MDKEKILKGIQLLLEGIGEHTQREGLIDTPKRVLKMIENFSQISSVDEQKLLDITFSIEQYSDFIIVKNIHFSSFCEHHLLPFFGNVSVAYIPVDNTVVGLSKIARIVDKYSKQLQLQERMTNQIANALNKNTKNNGIFVLVNAHHMCMGARGILQPKCTTITRTITGNFQKNQALASQVQQIIIAKH